MRALFVWIAALCSHAVAQQAVTITDSRSLFMGFYIHLDVSSTEALTCILESQRWTTSGTYATCIDQRLASTTITTTCGTCKSPDTCVHFTIVATSIDPGQPQGAHWTYWACRGNWVANTVYRTIIKTTPATPMPSTAVVTLTPSNSATTAFFTFTTSNPPTTAFVTITPTTPTPTSSSPTPSSTTPSSTAPSSTSPSSSSTEIGSSTSTTATQQSSTSPPVPQGSGGSPSQAWIAGAVVGPVVALTALAAFAIWLRHQRKNAKDARAQAQVFNQPLPPEPKPPTSPQQPYSPQQQPYNPPEQSYSSQPPQYYSTYGQPGWSPPPVEMEHRTPGRAM